jgi:hypothetical protein
VKYNVVDSDHGGCGFGKAGTPDAATKPPHFIAALFATQRRPLRVRIGSTWSIRARFASR